jgi:excisionase family DNA binding protein
MSESEPQYSPLAGMVEIREVAEACRVSVQTVRRWIAAGVIPPPRRFGRRCLRWPEAEINAWITAQNENREETHV